MFYLIIEKKNANNVLKSGLSNLIELCDVINQKFDVALDKFSSE